MILHSLSLTNFRNYSKAAFTFSPSTTLVVGPNTSGKTNLLEAIYYLATGRSFRATFDREVIKSGEVFARIGGIKGVKGIKEGDEDGLEITILANENGQNTSSKMFKVNGVKKRLSDFAGNLRAVYFGPEEIQLVTGSPSRRRRYLDSVLVQVDREYARTLLEYEKVLRQRNKLLLTLRERGLEGVKGVNGQLDFWDEKLLALGSVLSEKREAMFNYFSERLGGRLRLVFLKSMRPLVKEKQTPIIEREIAAGMTLWGPHRDDFCFTQMNVAARPWRAPPSLGDDRQTKGLQLPSSPRSDLSRFGSRGEQRLAVLHLKLAELEFIAARTGDRPVLLLDDIFSELDESNRGRVLTLLGKQQTIVTTTDLEQVDGGKFGENKVLELKILNSNI